MPQNPINPFLNSVRLGDLKNAVSQIPGSANLLMIIPNETVFPVTASVTTLPDSGANYVVLGYFDVATLTYQAVPQV